MRALIAAFVALASSACVSTNVQISEMGSTTFTTNPPGARVFINGAEICNSTPCSWVEGDGFSHRFHLQVRKEGYQDVDFYLDKELNILTGFLSPVGYKMPRQVSLMLTPAGGDVPPPPALPPPPPGQPTPPPPPPPSPSL